MKIAALQMVSTPDVGRNVEAACRLIAQAAAGGAQLVVLPEYFCLLGRRDDDKLAVAEVPGSGPIQHALASAELTREQYLKAPHIVPLPYSSTHRGVIDRHLAGLRVSRNARVIVPFFSMAPHLLPGSDLIFTISRHFAEHYAAFLPLKVVACPIDFPPMRFYQIWHSRTHGAAAQQWLRGVLKDVATRMLQGRQPHRARAFAGPQ